MELADWHKLHERLIEEDILRSDFKQVFRNIEVRWQCQDPVVDLNKENMELILVIDSTDCREMPTEPEFLPLDNIPKLHGKNYNRWKYLISDIIEAINQEINDDYQRRFNPTGYFGAFRKGE